MHESAAHIHARERVGWSESVGFGSFSHCGFQASSPISNKKASPFGLTYLFEMGEGGFEPCMNLLRIFMPENALVGLKVLVLVRSPIVVFKRLPPFRIKKPVNYD
ncbi:MAG: hypothetical protein E7658_08420 [Ruminococcaceae bacterium]|nr:hypothetical protein [Oscillospiraceae bacterium]